MQLAHQLAVAEPAALAQHAIDQRRLAVVDVGDDGDVADVVAAHGVAIVVRIPLGEPCRIP